MTDDERASRRPPRPGVRNPDAAARFTRDSRPGPRRAPASSEQGRLPRAKQGSQHRTRSQLAVEPPDRLRSGMVVNAEVLRNGLHRHAATPHLGRLSGDALVHRLASHRIADTHRMHSCTTQGTQCPNLKAARSKAANGSQLPVEPADGLTGRMIINAEVFRDSPHGDTPSPHLGRLGRDALVHRHRRRPDEIGLERQSGQGANAFLPGPPYSYYLRLARS